MHYKHMFLRGTYGFNQFFSGSEHYTDICYAYTGNVIIFTFHYKREFNSSKIDTYLNISSQLNVIYSIT